MAMRLPSLNGQTLFTVEQIELIRRLRNSGLTKDQIVNAFESLERLDRELGPVYNIPISQVANAVTFQQLQVQASQVANQVASQLAQVAQAAQIAQVAKVATTAVASGAAPSLIGATPQVVVGGQPVFPRPIAIAPTASLNTQQIPILSSSASSLLSSSSSLSPAAAAALIVNPNGTAITATVNSNTTPISANITSICGQNGLASPALQQQQPLRIKIDRKRSLSGDKLRSSSSSTSSSSSSSSIICSQQQLINAVAVLTTPNNNIITNITEKSTTNNNNPSSSPPLLVAETKISPNSVIMVQPMSPDDSNGGASPGPYGGPGSPLHEGYKIEGLPEISDTCEEYLSFIAQGERPCCEEIKDFVQKYNIRQQQIATLSGISQPYVSRFLRGEFSEMSPRSRRTIMKWYMTYKHHPTAIGVCQSYVSRFLRGEVFDMSGRSRQSIIKWYLAYKAIPNSIAPAVNAILMANGHPPAKKFISSLDVTSGEFVNAPRRERFVFRPNHVAILEKCFQEDSYPSFQKREEIARTLNATTEASTGKDLEEREIVTAQIISNWFANKRKEMKKIAREAYFKAQGLSTPGSLVPSDIDLEHLWAEGLDVSQVPLRPRGRPSGRFFLSMMPGSGGTGGQEQATDLSLNSQQPANLSLGNNNNNHVVATDLSLSNNEEATDLTVNNNNHQEMEMEENSDGNMSTPDLQDVELAAVNQAILSLTGQQPISIKMEKATEENDKENIQETAHENGVKT